ncbi:unnamed protein product, partial [marine sediment metagenome]
MEVEGKAAAMLPLLVSVLLFFTRLLNVAESFFHSSSNLFSVSKARCLAISFNREFKSCFLEISFLNSSFSEVAVFSYWEMEVLAFMP